MLSITFIVVQDGMGNSSSNPGQSCLHLTLRYEIKIHICKEFSLKKKKKFARSFHETKSSSTPVCIQKQ